MNLTENRTQCQGFPRDMNSLRTGISGEQGFRKNRNSYFTFGQNIHKW